jgi:hypothetical protein
LAAAALVGAAGLAAGTINTHVAIIAVSSALGGHMLRVTRYEHRTSLEMDIGHRLGMAELSARVHADAMLFAVTAPVGRDQPAGYPTCLPQELAFRYRQ